MGYAAAGVAQQCLRGVVIVPTPSRPVPELARAMTQPDLETLLWECHFPCDRKQCVDCVRDHFATADTLAVLDSIPNRTYQNVGDVYQAIQQLGQGQGRRQA